MPDRILRKLRDGAQAQLLLWDLGQDGQNSTSTGLRPAEAPIPTMGKRAASLSPGSAGAATAFERAASLRFRRAPDARFSRMEILWLQTIMSSQFPATPPSSVSSTLKDARLLGQGYTSDRADLKGSPLMEYSLDAMIRVPGCGVN